MSLYEQFHSDINKDHMYKLITKYVKENNEIDISNDSNNYQLFLKNMETVFNENNADEIETMNQYLLEYNVKFFINNEKKKNTEPIVKDEFEKLLQEREKQDAMSISSKDTSENITYNVKEVNADIESKNMIIERNVEPEPKKSDHESKLDPEPEPEKPSTLAYFNSSKRTNIHSSRYNYKIDLKKLKIKSSNINTLTKLLIPIEDNYLFSLPILVLNIPEFKYSIHIQQTETIENNHRKYGIYQPIENITFDNKNNIERITIDIRDVSEKKYNINDILKVNIVEFKNNRIYFTCSSIYKNDYQINDYIKIINNNTHNSLFSIFQEPLKIKKVQENVIVCDYRGLNIIHDNIYTNIDMKIMNMSNQNILYFN